MDCFVGVSDHTTRQDDISEVDKLVLGPGKKWPYAARYYIDLSTGEVKFAEVRTPG